MRVIEFYPSRGAAEAELAEILRDEPQLDEEARDRCGRLRWRRSRGSDRLTPHPHRLSARRRWGPSPEAPEDSWEARCPFYFIAGAQRCLLGGVVLLAVTVVGGSKQV
jgi:hypothetical protein